MFFVWKSTGKSPSLLAVKEIATDSLLEMMLHKLAPVRGKSNSGVCAWI
jgi:hypothetical protein